MITELRTLYFLLYRAVLRELFLRCTPFWHGVWERSDTCCNIAGGNVGCVKSQERGI